MFNFTGDLEISKSWLNRALILQSFQPELVIHGYSEAEDVRLLKVALLKFKSGETNLYAGLGGTTFRFLAFRISRQAGEYFLAADKKLLLRPQIEIVNILAQLGVQSELTHAGLKIRSEGWKMPNQPLKIDTAESSQFLSALALSSIDLDFDIPIEPIEKITSAGYFQMTLQMLQSIGVQFGQAKQKINAQDILGEIDISSSFSLVAAAVLSGDVQITNWNSNSSQPDILFLDFFKLMSINFVIKNNIFKINQQQSYLSLNADLSNCPDLFPVLSVLCAFAIGESDLYNAPQLKHKESDRIEKTYELLHRCGFKVHRKTDGLIISGDPNKYYKTKDVILFDPDGDHRMAMAAGLLMLKGFPIQMPDLNVVNKSYPQFFQHIGLVK
jgi:3-phosphoshikimate 1-carboxyvinyltransferase